MDNKYVFNDTEINNILYSTIYNQDHLKLRRKLYKRAIPKLVYVVLFKGNKISDPRPEYSLLNYLPKKYIDFSDVEKKIPKIEFDLETSAFKAVKIISLLLYIAFLLNFKPIQKLIFKLTLSKTLKLIHDYNLNILLCGHPTLTATFIGFCLRMDSRKKVITYQHGIYNLSKYKVLWFEKYIASKIIVFGSYFKDLYMEQGVINEKITIGNPFFKSKFLQNEKNNISVNFPNKQVLFIGQPFYQSEEEVFESYNKSILSLIDVCEAKNIVCYYKAHPREDINKSLNKRNLSKLKIFSDNIHSKAFSNDFDIYYSFNSTLLLEVYLDGKICYQLNLPGLKLDKFSVYTGIPYIDSTNLSDHLDNKSYEFHIDSGYLNLTSEPKLKLLNNILAEINQV